VGVTIMLLHPPPLQQLTLGLCFPQTFELEKEEQLVGFMTEWRRRTQMHQEFKTIDFKLP